MIDGRRLHRITLLISSFVLATVESWAQSTSQPVYERYDFKILQPKTTTGAPFVFSSLAGIAVASDGTIYVSDFGRQIICKIASDGVTSIVAEGTSSTLRLPRGLAVNSANTLFVANQGGVIESVSPTGTVTALAGSYNNTGWADGAGAMAQFSAPEALAFDPLGNLMVADTGNRRVRKITPSGVVSTIAGRGIFGNQDGPALSATFADLSGVAVDGSGSVFVMSSTIEQLRKISNGIVTTIAGNGSGMADGMGLAAQFRGSGGIAVDHAGNVFVADTNNSCIRKITPAGSVSTLGGTPSMHVSFEGSGPTALMERPSAIAVGPEGWLYVTEAGNAYPVIRVGAPTGTFFEPNDDFLNRLPLTGNISTTGSNVRARAETGEPAHYYSTATHSVWWSWTATNFGQLTVSTTGSSFDTVLALYTGTDVSHLQFIGGDDESGGHSTSRATIFVVPGVSYAIAVDGYDGSTGNIALQTTFTPSSVIFAASFDSYPTGPNYPLGLDGWLGSNFKDGAVAVVPSTLPSNQEVRIGNALTQDSAVELWRPLNVDIVAAGGPLVEFTTDVAISASTNGKRDNFYFVLDDLNGNPIAALNFDNNDSKLYRYDGQQFFELGSFSPDTRYPLKITFDFAKNRWTAALGTTTLFTDAQLTATGRPPSLGDIAAYWQITTKGSPGDNAMTFDNYRVALSGSVPTIIAGPSDVRVAAGSSLVLSVTAEGAGLNYQWYKNGVPLAGATAASYSVAATTAIDAGSYAVRVFDATYSVVSTPAAVTIATTSDVGRLINLSVRTHAGSGGGALLVGVVVGGTGTGGTKPMLIRAVGPTLGAYGVNGVLVNPALEFINQSTHAVAASNDDWLGDAQVAATGNQVGAFALASAASKDAAVVVTQGSGPYAVKILGGADPSSDIALAEIYDAEPVATHVPSSPRLINVSARAQVDTGDGILISGFVIGGSTARTVLIRGIGPTLANFGVNSVLTDPKLQLYRRINGNDMLIAANDDWGLSPSHSDIVTTAVKVGAFPLESGSKDATILITLPPGVYSAQLSGVNGTTGVGLVEVYEVP